MMNPPQQLPLAHTREADPPGSVTIRCRVRVSYLGVFFRPRKSSNASYIFVSRLKI